MQQEKDRGFSLPALGLGMVTATLAGSFYGKAGAYSARSVLLLGLLSALALAVLCRMFALWAQKTGLFDGSGFCPVWRAGAFFSGSGRNSSARPSQPRPSAGSTLPPTR